MPDNSTDHPAPIYVGQQGFAAIPFPEEQPGLHEAQLAAERNAIPAGVPPLVATRQDVVTSDGFELGQVKEVNETHFRIDVPKGGDFWLAADDVAESRGQLVVLNFDQSEIDAHARSEPAPSDTLLSVSQQQEQRERMEAELAAQRAALQGRSN